MFACKIKIPTAVLTETLQATSKYALNNTREFKK